MTGISTLYSTCLRRILGDVESDADREVGPPAEVPGLRVLTPRHVVDVGRHALLERLVHLVLGEGHTRIRHEGAEQHLLAKTRIGLLEQLVAELQVIGREVGVVVDRTALGVVAVDALQAAVGVPVQVGVALRRPNQVDHPAAG
jgi:hypothetical protein